MIATPNTAQATPSRRLRCVALACMTPEVDANEHARELPSYGIHRIQMDATAGVFSREYLVRELEGLVAHAAKSVFHVDSGLNLNAAAFRNLADACRFLDAEAAREGGRGGDYLWTFPPPAGVEPA